MHSDFEVGDYVLGRGYRGIILSVSIQNKWKIQRLLIQYEDITVGGNLRASWESSEYIILDKKRMRNVKLNEILNEEDNN